VRILFLTHRLPYPPNRGDRLRAHYMLRFLSARADVDLVSLVHDDWEEQQAEKARSLARSVTSIRVPRHRNLLRAAFALPGPTPLTHILLDAPDVRRRIVESVRERPDVVLAYCSSMAKFALQPPFHAIPLVLDMVDVDSRKWHDMAEHAHAPMKWVYRREANRLRAFESLALRRADATLIVNDREAVIAEELVPWARVQVVSNGLDVAHLHPTSPPTSEARVVFCGVMDYMPNELGALWLVQHVWPRVKAMRPDATLTIVGSNPTARLRRACAGDRSIEVTGWVRDVRPYLWRSAVSVAPLQVARGIQNKVLEAAGAGLPVVATSAVLAGLPETIRRACAVGNMPDEFAAAILKFLAATPEARRACAARARLHELSWDTVLAPLWDTLNEVVDRTVSMEVAGT
jgi:sugar transferase (PEP-CTERM/EpsH1 system associated)